MDQSISLVKVLAQHPDEKSAQWGMPCAATNWWRSRMRLALDSKTPAHAQPQAFPSSPFPMTDHSSKCLHRSSWCISHAHRNSSALIQHRCRNILQSPSSVIQQISNPANHLPSISALHPPFPFHQSWRTNQEALPYGIDPKEHSAREALPFSNISQRQLKVSLICRRGTVLAGSPWRPPTTFQILCMTFPFSAAPSNPWPDVQFLVP